MYCTPACVAFWNGWLKGAVIDEQWQYDEEPPILNVVQIVALNVVFGFGLLVTLRLGGASWGASIGVAWIGGAVLTFATAAVFALIWGRRRTSASAPRMMQQEGPKLVDHAITDAVQLWEADGLTEMEFALDSVVENSAIKPKPASPADTRRMWIEDAEADAALPERRLRKDR
ncbi:MAG: hypothetical protein WBV78_13875 [Roseobacter sp.]